MCGRTCLTLEPKEIASACKYRSKNIKNTNTTDNVKPEPNDSSEIKLEDAPEINENRLYITPEWRAEYNCGRKYTPSYNITPSDITPVLVSADHFGKDATDDEAAHVLVPMLWGMIPFWHKGDYRKHGLTTNNCRLEHLMESKLYRGPLQRGQRCVILCEGFYEWQTTKSAKPSERAVHMLYMPQKDGVQIYDKATWNPENVNLLKMAGLFDVWEDENGDKIYSYSVITFESTKIMSWLHHRMPAILETDEQVNDWLDYKRVPCEKAVSLLRPATQLTWHRVSNHVNNSRNKSNLCNKPIELCSAKPNNRTMLAWLNVRKRREEDIAKSNGESDEETNVTGSTSESENENHPKRPKYRDFKKSRTSK